jgi:hypothetical protein
MKMAVIYETQQFCEVLESTQDRILVRIFDDDHVVALEPGDVWILT